MAARFWISATGGSWNNTANWSDSPGGTGGASVPSSSDDAVFIDPVNSGAMVSGPFTSVYSLFLNPNAFQGYFQGGFITINQGLQTSDYTTALQNMAFTLSPIGSGILTLDLNGSPVIELDINGSSSGTVVVSSPINVSSVLYFFSGTFDNINSNIITSASVRFSGSSFKNIKFDDGINPATWMVTGSGGNAWTVGTATNINFTFSNTTSIVMQSASPKNFFSGNNSYPTLIQGGTGALTISGNSNFYSISNFYTTRKVPTTINFASKSKTSFSNVDLLGTSGNLLTLKSSQSGNTATLFKSGGIVSSDYLSIQDINAIGDIWYAGVNSTNVSNVSGWIFTSPPQPMNPGNFLAFFSFDHK